MFQTGDLYGYERTAEFPKEDHPWLVSTRQENIEKMASKLLEALDVFLGTLPNGLDRTREVVAHAVQLNEYIMHQLEQVYKIDFDTGEPDDFYENLDNMEMTAVNTDSGDWVSVRHAIKGRSQEDIRSRLYKVCVIQPALKHQESSGLTAREHEFGPIETKVKSRVAVGWATIMNRNKLNPPEDPRMFYIMAQSLGFAPLRQSST